MAIAPYLEKKGFEITLDENEARYLCWFDGFIVARVDYVAAAYSQAKENLFVDEILRARPDLSKEMGIGELEVS